MASSIGVLSKSSWSWYTILVLFCLLTVQILWFIGTTTLRDYEGLQKEIRQIDQESARISAAAGGAQPSVSAQNLIAPLQKQLDALQPQAESALEAIKTWNKTWHWVVPWSADRSGVVVSTAANKELRIANGAAQVLGLYILPLFYGWLGALLSVVQKLREDDSPQAVARLKPGSRVVTGMVAGPMIGMFLSPELLNSLAYQAAPFLVAFIGGYSTDVFFALIDRFLHIFRQALEKQDQPPPERQQPAAEAKPPASHGGEPKA
ncbi:MAG: hypothetical protein ACHQF3_11390 [Alphaproteobacteria bacterium]